MLNLAPSSWSSRFVGLKRVSKTAGGIDGASGVGSGFQEDGGLALVLAGRQVRVEEAAA
jgi:hypothetical protein